MTTLTVLRAPAIGASYRKHSTGRAWHVARISGSGLIRLTESFYGAGCDVSCYVTNTELGSEYEPAA